MYSTVLSLSSTATIAPAAEATATPQREVEVETPAEVTEQAKTVTPIIPRHVMAPEDEVEDPEVPAQSLMDPVEQNNNEVLFEAESDDEPEPLSAIEFEPLSEAAVEPEPIAETPLYKESEPQPTTKPVDTKTTAPQVAPAVATSRQSSLFDYIRSGNQNPEPVSAETLGDRIGRTGNEMRGETAQHKHVSDLRTVININDKFSFMKDLFQNNMKAYNDFIIQLNSIDDRATAQRRVDEVSQIYNWDKNSLTVKTFYSIFDRKF